MHVYRKAPKNGFKLARASSAIPTTMKKATCAYCGEFQTRTSLFRHSDYFSGFFLVFSTPGFQTRTSLFRHSDFYFKVKRTTGTLVSNSHEPLPPFRRLQRTVLAI